MVASRPMAPMTLAGSLVQQGGTLVQPKGESPGQQQRRESGNGDQWEATRKTNCGEMGIVLQCMVSSWACNIRNFC